MNSLTYSYLAVQENPSIRVIILVITPSIPILRGKKLRTTRIAETKKKQWQKIEQTNSTNSSIYIHEYQTNNFGSYQQNIQIY